MPERFKTIKVITKFITVVTVWVFKLFTYNKKKIKLVFGLLKPQFTDEAL
jgi:hypothetical protein